MCLLTVNPTYVGMNRLFAQINTVHQSKPHIRGDEPQDEWLYSSFWCKPHIRGDEPYERKNYVAMPRVKIICEGREKQKQEGNTISERLTIRSQPRKGTAVAKKVDG